MLVKDKYTSIIGQLGHNNIVISSSLAAQLSIQVTMIDWVDDTAKMWHKELQTCHAFPGYGVTTKIC